MKCDYYNSETGVEKYIQAAKDVNGKEFIEKLSKYLPNDSTVLELGSGYSLLSFYLSLYLTYKNVFNNIHRTRFRFLVIKGII
jgi:hypothetical protein